MFYVSVSFYRAMHFSAKRGIAIACRLSVCLSVRPCVCNVGGSGSQYVGNLVLADRTALSVIGYWHHYYYRLSVRQSVTGVVRNLSK